MALDLNLLAVLEAVMQERNVSRAASALAMSQPAVSNALRRARNVTNDQLFLKVSGGVQPTARMLAMWPDLHRSLVTLRALLTAEKFDPSSDRTTFRLAVTDNLVAELVPAVTLALLEAAPSARVHFTPHTNAGSLERIERGTLDCAVGMFPSLPRTILVQGLQGDQYLCVMRQNHPLAGHLTLDGFLAASHVLVTPSGLDLGAVDGWLGIRGLRRTILATVNHCADALQIVAQSDHLTCVPGAFLESSAGRKTVADRKLVVCNLPFDAEPLLYKLVWHERLEHHQAHRWFRGLIAAVTHSHAHSPSRKS